MNIAAVAEYSQQRSVDAVLFPGYLTTVLLTGVTIVYYRNYGWEGLVAEVEMDVKRISHRNLGRDDRSVCTYVSPVAIL